MAVQKSPRQKQRKDHRLVIRMTDEETVIIKSIAIATTGGNVAKLIRRKMNESCNDTQHMLKVLFLMETNIKLIEEIRQSIENEEAERANEKLKILANDMEYVRATISELCQNNQDQFAPEMQQNK